MSQLLSIEFRHLWFLYKSVSSWAKKKETPLANNKPGRHWYELFLKRHPKISLRVSQNLTSSRSAVTAQQIRNWFEEMHLYLCENDHLEIIKGPKQIFNCDETSFFLCPKEENVLVKKGDKIVQTVVNSEEKECMITLSTGNANGNRRKLFRIHCKYILSLVEKGKHFFTCCTIYRILLIWL